MKAINWIVRFWIFSILLGLSTGCHLVYLHMAEPSYLDKSQDSCYQHLVGQRIKLKQEAFLYYYQDTREYVLEVPGQSTELPTTIQDYRDDPINWMYTDTFAKQGKGKREGYGKQKVMAVLTKGTRLYVSNVLEKQSSESSSISVIAYVDDPCYGSLPVDIYFLLKKYRPLGKALEFELNPSVLEFCR